MTIKCIDCGTWVENVDLSTHKCDEKLCCNGNEY